MISCILLVHVRPFVKVLLFQGLDKYIQKILDSKRGSKKLSRNIAGMWLRIYCRHPADLYC